MIFFIALYLIACFCIICDYLIEKNIRLNKIIICNLYIFIINIFLFSEIKSFLSCFLRNDGNPLSFFLGTGSALLGAISIAFALVTFVMQVNIERMPHALFRKASEDKRLLICFCLIFVLSLLLTCFSLIPIKHSEWICIAMNGSFWIFLWVIFLFLSIYKRALELVNPLQQLNFIISEIIDEMQKWNKQILQFKNSINNDNSSALCYAACATFPVRVRQSIQYISIFSRKYAEQREYMACEKALQTLIAINSEYIKVKGNFQGMNIFLGPTDQIDYVTDDFIDDSLEIFRQNIQLGILHGDERDIRLNLHALKNLIIVYTQINYLDLPVIKLHARIASSDLINAIQELLIRKSFNLINEGIDIVYQLIESFIRCGDFEQVSLLVDRIREIACNQYVSNEKYVPSIIKAITQISRLTLMLFNEKTGTGEIISNIQRNITEITGFIIHHSLILKYPYACLDSYYSTKFNSKTTFLAHLNEILDKNLDTYVHRHRHVIQNIEIWAQEQWKNGILIGLAIDKKAEFAKDMINWLVKVTKLLIKNGFSDQAFLLFSTFPMPDEKDALEFLKDEDSAEKLFEIAKISLDSKDLRILKKSQDMLLEWAIKTTKHEIQNEQSLKSFLGLAVLSLLTREENNLMNNILKQKDSLVEEARKNISSSLYNYVNNEMDKEDEMDLLLSSIKQAKKSVNSTTIKSLLMNIAKILFSPSDN